MNSILVVDDDELVRKSVTMALKANGFSVDSADCGKEAVEKTIHRRYDSAIIDLKMPGMDGFEVSSFIRGKIDNIVFMTGYVKEYELLESKRLLMKPFGVDELIRHIKDNAP